MPVIHHETLIEASPAQIFALLDDPHRFPRYAPGVKAVSEVRQTDQRIGDSFRVTYAAMGIPFRMKFTIVDHAKDRAVTARFEGGMTGTFAWRLQPDGNATRVAVDIDYRMSGGSVGAALGKLFFERMNENNARQMLTNLKRAAESS
jgi:carbon monoxide dehydrogenase subunit G